MAPSNPPTATQRLLARWRKTNSTSNLRETNTRGVSAGRRPARRLRSGRPARLARDERENPPRRAGDFQERLESITVLECRSKCAHPAQAAAALLLTPGAPRARYRRGDHTTLSSTARAAAPSRHAPPRPFHRPALTAGAHAPQGRLTPQHHAPWLGEPRMHQRHRQAAIAASSSRVGPTTKA